MFKITFLYRNLLKREEEAEYAYVSQQNKMVKSWDFKHKQSGFKDQSDKHTRHFQSNTQTYNRKHHNATKRSPEKRSQKNHVTRYKYDFVVNINCLVYVNRAMQTKAMSNFGKQEQDFLNKYYNVFKIISLIGKKKVKLDNVKPYLLKELGILINFL